MNTTLHKSDKELKADVLAELKYEPSVNIADIGVLVKDGAVTLNGFATSFIEKWNAVRAAKRVAGVSAIADDIAVKLPNSPHTDTDIAVAAAHHLKWAPSVPFESVQATVRNGGLTLTGEVEWWYQRNCAELAVQNLEGVTDVFNLIEIKPKLKPTDIEAGIRAAFSRNAVLDANHITVETSGSNVTLKGNVRNFAEREEAERVAWAAPGVFSVNNKITLSWLDF